MGRFRRTKAGLIATAFLAPFSATRLVDPLTLGRVVALTFAVLLVADLFESRPRGVRPEKAAVLVIAAYAGLFAWILLNTAAWGCNCDGKLGGFAEFAFVGVLAVVAITLEPSLRGPAMLATLAGLAFAATLALIGVGSINSGTIDLTQTGGRLSGTYGNANELGFAIALGIPISLAFMPTLGRRERIALGGVLLLLAATLLLTYSRGGLIAASVGVVTVALWLARGSRRRVATILVGVGVAVVAAAFLYSFFERERREASFTPVSPALRPLNQRDLSGWDSRALGPIPRGPSRLVNRPGGIAVRGGRGGEGASFRWGEAGRGGTYELRFRARDEGGGRSRIGYALGDEASGVVGRHRTAGLGPAWRSFSLAWHPRVRAPQATLYVWRLGGSSAFLLADVSVLARARGRPAAVVEVPRHLKGSIYDHLTAIAKREESRYIHSRLDAARLALRAFWSQPLRGIGWGTFPAYAAEHLDYGQLAAHDEYLGVAAELGILGLLLLGLLIASVLIGMRKVGPSRAETAAIGVLAAAAAGMVFVEALPIPQLSVPLALAVAVVCGRRRPESG